MTRDSLPLAPAEAGRPIRVLFVMIQMAMGGSERLVFNLVKNLDRRRIEPSVAWFEQPVALKEFEALGVPLHFVPKQRRMDWGTVRRLAAIVREQRVDVINAHHFMPFVYSFCAARLGARAGLVYTEHSEADVLHVGARWHRLGRHLLRRADATVGISQTVSAALAHHFSLDPSRVQTIENGVDVSLFRRPEHRRLLRAAIGCGDGDFVIGHVANFRRNKNHLFLLRAFKELLRHRPDARLVLVGRGQAGDPENSEPDVARFVEEHGLSGAVRMLGYRADVPALLGALDTFCLVSYREGLPFSILEAMATGMPVIGTAIDGIRDVVRDGVNGFCVTPDEVPALADALRRLADDCGLRERMGAAARATVVERYSLDRCLSRTEELFLSVSRSGAGNPEPDPRVSRAIERTIS